MDLWNLLLQIFKGFSLIESKIHTRHTIPVPHDKPEYKSAFISFTLLMSVIERSEIQIKRIKLDRKHQDLKLLFTDIQFFLITISNIQKMMLRLKKILYGNKDYMLWYKKFINKIETLDSFRDNLEHIDERLDGVGKKGKPLLQPNMLGTLLNNDEYNFGGEKFNLSDAFIIIEMLKKDLVEWNKNNYKFPCY